MDKKTPGKRKTVKIPKKSSSVNSIAYSEVQHQGDDKTEPTSPTIALEDITHGEEKMQDDDDENRSTSSTTTVMREAGLGTDAGLGESIGLSRGRVRTGASDPSVELTGCEGRVNSPLLLDWHPAANSQLARNDVITCSVTECLKQAWSIINTYLFLADVGTDMYAAEQYLINDKFYYGIITICFILQPIIVICIMDIYEEFQKSKRTFGSRCLFVTTTICMAPIRPFNLAVNNVVASTRGCVNDVAAREIGLLKLLEGMFEAFPQACFQFYIIGIANTSDTDVELWTLVTAATSLISLAFTVSTSTFLFDNVPMKTKVVFFFLGIVNVFARFIIFLSYAIGMGPMVGLLIPGTLLFASICVWLFKRYCRCPQTPCSCRYVLHIDAGRNCDNKVLSWVLTSVYNCFNMTGLLLSTLNLAFSGPIIYYLITDLTTILDEGFLVIYFIIVIPAVICFICNVFLVAIPSCSSIGKHWVNSDNHDATVLY